LIQVKAHPLKKPTLMNIAAEAVPMKPDTSIFRSALCVDKTIGGLEMNLGTD
jgi:hypothetical protein